MELMKFIGSYKICRCISSHACQLYSEALTVPVIDTVNPNTAMCSVGAISIIKSSFTIFETL